MNGSQDALWDKVNRIAEQGCALRGVHEKAIEDEKKERKEMMAAISREIKSVRNQILVGVILVMALALVVDKILK